MSFSSEIIKSQIHNSKLFGIFIELGLGNPVSNELCGVSGASKTVFYSENPYNDTISKYIYEIPEDERLVSVDAISRIINSEKIRNLLQYSEANVEINTIYVSSFQIGEYNDKVTHGYIGLKYFDEIFYYHITVRDSLSRLEYIKKIKNLSIQMLIDLSNRTPITQNIGNDCSIHIDGIWNYDLSSNVIETLNANNRSLLNEMGNNIFYVKNNNLLRLENLTRSAKKGLIIYKGSFNPISNAHLSMIEQAKEKFPDYEVCFSISLSTFGKTHNSSENIAKRIELINDLGYGVLICHTPYFDNLHISLNNAKYDNNVVYVMGMDTATRLNDCGYTNFSNRKFLIFDRKNSTNKKVELINSETVTFDMDVSSTQIREYLKISEYSKLKKLVPEKIFEKLIDNKELFI